MYLTPYKNDKQNIHYIAAQESPLDVQYNFFTFQTSVFRIGYGAEIAQPTIVVVVVVVVPLITLGSFLFTRC